MVNAVTMQRFYRYYSRLSFISPGTRKTQRTSKLL